MTINLKAEVYQADWRAERGADYEKFDLVAEVNLTPEILAASKYMGILDYAYEYTNTIDAYWWDNPYVTPKFQGEGCRSTSMGDVIKVDGALYRVEAFGFKQIDKIGNIQ